MLAEIKTLLFKLQASMLCVQVVAYAAQHRFCAGCWVLRTLKERRTRRLQTLLGALGRITNWAKDAIVPAEPGIRAKVRHLVARCTELRSYVGNKDVLIDDGQRYHAGKPIST